MTMRLRFGSWTLDADRRLLLDGGEPVSLSPKAFELLRLLAERHQRAFSKAELHELLWPNTFVTDGNLTILVAEIRGVLKDDADRPRFIRTVRRFGYAFCAAVVRADAAQGVAGGSHSGWVIWGNKSIALAEGETILGRALDAHICFNVPGVSRRHARIVVADNRVTIADLESQNGTYVAGKRISLATLSDGDEIHLGPVSIVFRVVSPDTSTYPMT